MESSELGCPGLEWGGQDFIPLIDQSLDASCPKKWPWAPLSAERASQRELPTAGGDGASELQCPSQAIFCTSWRHLLYKCWMQVFQVLVGHFSWEKLVRRRKWEELQPPPLKLIWGPNFKYTQSPASLVQTWIPLILSLCLCYFLI